MSIETIPLFYYIDPITSLNNTIDFKEPTQLNVDLVAEINFGSRSITNLMIEVQRALNDSGVNDYTVSFNRVTKLVTISSTVVFELFVTSGANAAISPWSLLGFETDQTGASSYTGTLPIGSEYSPQFKPQKFEAFEDNLEAISPAVRESADGIIEVVSFGNKQLMSMNIKYITNRLMGKDSAIKNNPNALSEVRNFLTFAIKKSDMEFMIDENDRNSFETVLLEKSAASRDGTSFKLKELVNEKLIGFFETGTLTFRKI